MVPGSGGYRKVRWSHAGIGNPRLSKARCAKLLGLSLRTLKCWEQDRIQPSGAACTLLAIALRNPAALLDVAA